MNDLPAIDLTLITNADPLQILYGAVACAAVLLIVVGLLWRRVRQQRAAWNQLSQTHDALREQLEDTENQHTVLAENYRDLELTHTTLDTQHRMLSERISASESQARTEAEKLQGETAARHQAQNDNSALRAQLQQQQQQHGELANRLTQLQSRFDALQEAHAALQAQNSELRTAQVERDRSYKQQLAHFDEQKQALSEQFQVLANDILDAKSKKLHENSKQSMDSIINPFRQQIDSFKKEVQEIHHRETTQQGELRKELATLKELNQQITAEAHELSTALRGQKKLQGNWGELILENVLDRSGLQQGKDYDREVSINTEDGRQRPDAIVYLPHKKHLIIDAKVSLNAYTRFVNAEDDLTRQQALQDHVRAVAQRIDELAARDYYKLSGLNSPEMVFMFIPIESAFVEALKADENLFQQAIANNVLVATPTTLLTSLNIVRQLWRYEDQNKHTAALARKADGVFRKLNSFLGSFEDIRKGIEKASEAYAKAEGQLVSGKGNLVKQVGEFKKLAPAIKAELPDYFTDKADLEIDYVAAERGAGDEQAPAEHGGDIQVEVDVDTSEATPEPTSDDQARSS